MTSSNVDIEQLYTMEQVAERMGVAESWVRTEVLAGKFPHYRIGEKQRIRITANQVAQYLAEREKPSA